MASPGTLADLQRVIRRIEGRHRPAAERPRRAVAIEEAVGGTVEETAAGPVLVVVRRYPLAQAHGAQPLAGAAALAPECLAVLARSPGGLPLFSPRLLYLDTETTGLAGGTGTYAFLVGAGFVDGEDFEVRQYFLRDLDEEPALLTALGELLGRFDGLVTYNGTGFDLPLLETRFVLGRRRWSADAVHLDLLLPARRIWSGHLEDCRLASVERHALGVERDGDIAGSLIPYVYFDWLRHKRPGQLPRVFEHNRLDVLSLAALTGWVAAALARAPEVDLAPVELAGLGWVWELADAERAVACYRAALELGLDGEARARVMGRLARREKRQARWRDARELWSLLAREQGRFDHRPWEEVAKIDEHRHRDLGAARAVVEEALARARAAGVASHVMAALDHRLARLRRRLQAPA
jgi:uncharacterized protein YprB with RNaseH-like and TPR domain